MTAPPLDAVRPGAATEGPAAAGRRPWLRGLGVSVLCSLLGPLVFLVVLGSRLEEGLAPRVPVLWALLLVIDVAVGLAAGVLVGVARGSRGVALALVAASTVSLWAGPAGAVALVRLGSRRSLTWAGLALVLVVPGGLAVARVQEHAAPSASPPLPLWAEALGLAAVAVALLLWGRVRGTRAALVESLRLQAAAAEGERLALARSRDADVARTRAEERSAIARDMHDTLSHQLSLIAMHAGALAYREDLPPERVRAAARTVRDAAGEANAVLREVLLALRSTDPDQRLGHHGGAEPLPTSVDETAARARERGQRVDVSWDGLSADDLRGRSPATTVSLAQITAELLVNAAKHAPGSPVDVALSRGDGRLVLRASNPLPGATATDPGPGVGTGLGLVGVSERARLLGGGARYGATPDGAFEVEVEVPWTA